MNLTGLCSFRGTCRCMTYVQTVRVGVMLRKVRGLQMIGPACLPGGDQSGNHEQAHEHEHQGDGDPAHDQGCSCQQPP